MNAIHVVGAALLRGDRVLVARRGPGMSLAGQWEFPGGKVEPGEDPEAALVREIREELDLEIRLEGFLGTGRARLGESLRVIQLDVYRATAVRWDLRLSEHSEARWIGVEEIDELDWAEADRPVLSALREELAGSGPSSCDSVRS